jgi:hypothetical protein
VVVCPKVATKDHLLVAVPYLIDGITKEKKSLKKNR